MIEVEELESLGKKKEKENYAFRTYLKCHADEKQLDKDFKEIHNKVFKNYDCSKCRNCCKKLGLSLSEVELVKICNFYQLDINELKNNILKENYGEYVNKANPCPFLNNDNSCRICKCLPRSCKDYPYTDKPERLFSLLTIVKNSTICPAVYEILEELKEKYNFRSSR